MLDYIKNNRIAGVYEYINNNTGALYVGSADDIWIRHLKHLYISDIDLAIHNEGLKSFTFKVLEEFPLGTDRSILRQNERKWIDYYDAENNPLHYNIGQGRYKLWDTKKVHHDARRVGNGVGKSFNVKAGTFGNHQWNRTGLPIGAFCEFVSPTIIYDLSQKWF